MGRGADRRSPPAPRRHRRGDPRFGASSFGKAQRRPHRETHFGAAIGQVEAIVPGRLLAAELDEDDGPFVHELRWQLADGRRLEIELDARDGRWLKLKGPRLETVFRRSPTATAPAAVSGR